MTKENKTVKINKQEREAQPGGSLWRRFKIYGVGFGIGLMFVLLLTENRGCSWLPANRVKNSILERILVANASSDAKLKAYKIDKTELENALNVGKVLFSQSKKTSTFKFYLIEHTLKSGKTVTLEFTLPENSFVSEVFVLDPKKPIRQNTVIGTGTIYRYFAQGKAYSSAIFVDENTANLLVLEKMGFYKPVSLEELAAAGKERAKESQIELPKETMQSNGIQLRRLDRVFKSSATIDFSNCNWKANDRPTHAFNFKTEDGKVYKATAILFQDKIKLTIIQ